MKAEMERNGNKLIIKVGQKLTADNAPELQALIDEAVDNDVRELIFDVSEMPYTSSAGLRVFLAAQYMMEDRDGELELIGVSETVSEILKETGFNTFLKYSLLDE